MSEHLSLEWNLEVLDGGECQQTFKVSHKRLGSAVEGIDDHLAVRRPSDFRSSVLQAWSWRCAMPGGLSADMSRLWREVNGNTRVPATLAFFAGSEEGQSG